MRSWVAQFTLQIKLSIVAHTLLIDLAWLGYVNDDYAGILEYPVSSPLVDWQLVYVCSVHTIDAAVDASPVNECSSIKLKYVN